MGSPVVEIASSIERAAQARIEIVVLFTDVPATLAALRTAAQLASGLFSRIRLLALHCVPYPLPLDKPTVDLRFLGQRFRTVAENHSVETFVDVRLCRDTWETLRTMLAPQSVIVIGRRTGWWPRSEDGLAKRLRADGHHVIRTSFHKENAHA